MINLKFEQIINNLKETIKDQKVLLACSTGVDSMVLLDLLLKSYSKRKYYSSAYKSSKKRTINNRRRIHQRFFKKPKYYLFCPSFTTLWW